MLSVRRVEGAAGVTFGAGNDSRQDGGIRTHPIPDRRARGGALRIGRPFLRIAGVLACAVALAAAALPGPAGANAAQHGGLGQQLALALPIAGVDVPLAVRAEAATQPWFASRKDKRVKVQGSVGSEEDRKTILGMFKASMPDVEIDDRMKVAEGVADHQTWLAAVSFAIVQLGHLRRGYALLEGVTVSLEGEARSAESYAAVQSALAALPRGVAVKQASVSPPVVKPFTWTAQFENGTLTLTGAVLDEGQRAEMLARIAELFPNVEIVDRMEMAAGAPGAWGVAVMAALAQLSRLDEGKVTIAETVVSIEGMTQSQPLAADIVAALRSSLPQEYETKESLRTRASAPPASPPKAVTPESPEKATAEPSMDRGGPGRLQSWLVRSGAIVKDVLDL